MAKRARVWIRTLPAEEKAAIAAVCQRFTAETRKPHFRAHGSVTLEDALQLIAATPLLQPPT